MLNYLIYIYILFKLLNIVVDVAFKLFIDNIGFVDKLFTFVVNANTDILIPVAMLIVLNYLL
jgi:hypothetical protein